MEINLNKNNFQTEVLESSLPVLVDFWAPWCGPCKIMSPLVDQLGQDLDGKVKVVKVNVDENNDLAMQYQVMSIPTFKMFKGGKVVAEAIGAMPKEALRSSLMI